ncbi:hypothetical protein B0H15DRAFT_812448 [Mycena belliarum]|uniref:Uncharacterized protein n=1 Tax=Mycena belliarum TaxID=1033014 RepID=A0AAD6UHU9_9AGAR|nr:hypothetical protein B0H15DRAFT_812448 [Mycena belliae]
MRFHAKTIMQGCYGIVVMLTSPVISGHYLVLGSNLIALVSFPNYLLGPMIRPLRRRIEVGHPHVELRSARIRGYRPRSLQG